MGGSFIPKSRNWRWMYDNAAEPTISYAPENTTTGVTGSSSAVIFRLRLNAAETGGKTATNKDIGWVYSTNGTVWNVGGPTAGWNYADGQGTHGSSVTSFLLSDTTTYGQYIESTTTTNYNFASGSNNEFDFAITPGTGFVSGQLYYFALTVDDVKVDIDTGESYPTLTFTVTSPTPSATPTNTPTQTPSQTPTRTPSTTPTPSNTPSQTPSITPSQTPTPSITPSQTPSITPSQTPSITPSQSPSITPTPSQTPSQTPSITPSQTPTQTPSITPTPSPSGILTVIKHQVIFLH